MKRLFMRGVRGIGSIIGSALHTIAVAATIAATLAIGVSIANYNMTVPGSGTSFGSVVLGGVHYAQQFICDLTTPAQCTAVDGSGNLSVKDAALLAAVQASVPAGENHIGEIGSNQIKVQVAQTVTASSAYSTGNAIGGLMTVANAARVSGSLGAAGTGGLLTGLAMNSKSLQTTQVDVFLFDANPTGSTCTDKTAFSLVTADFDKVVGILTIPSTAANGAGWFGGGTGSVGVPNYFPVTYNLSSATSIYACAVTRGTPTYTATTDVSFKFNFLRN